MKKFLTVLTLALAMVLPARAQFLKGVVNSVKNTVENRAYDTVRSTTNKAIDKSVGKGKKPSTNGPTDSSGTPGATATASTSGANAMANSSGTSDANSTAHSSGTSSANSTAHSSGTSGASNTAHSSGESVATNTATPAAAGRMTSANPNAGPPSTKGYVRVAVSADRTIVGAKVTLTGFSPKYGNLRTVVLTITGGTAIPAQTILLKDSGSFSTAWMPTVAGHYTLTVTSQDGKAQQSTTVDAYAFVEMDQITAPTREEGQKVLDKLKATVEEAKTGMSAGDAAKLDDQIQHITKKWSAFSKEMDDLDQAGKGLDGLQKKYGGLPSYVIDDVGKISEDFSQEGRDLATVADAPAGGKSDEPDHAAYDNTVCEYLTMISEVCAAFSTLMNYEGDVVKLIKNLTIDKAAPALAETGSNGAGAGTGTTIFAKEMSKLFTQAGLDAESFTSMSGTAGFAGDMVQMASNYLLKTYCVVLDGDLQETYTCTYYNAERAVWWKYKYTTGATITLRYPKGKSGGGMIKMKGNIEGNATKFSIYTDMNEEDGFRKTTKGLTHAEGICVYAPPAFPFVSGQADRKTGFGAVARTAVTPACFNIPVDVDYDVDGKTMKFQTNGALVDFTPMIKYVYLYWGIAAGIPLTTIVDLPINNVAHTLGKAISMYSTFPVVKDAKNNISVKADADAKVGTGGEHEHDIKFSFSAKGS